MRLLIDNALSPRLANGLRDDGHDVVHVRDIGLHAASDSVIFDLARAQDRIVLSEDTDFGTLLAIRVTPKPSVVLFRGVSDRNPDNLLSLFRANLAAMEADLENGAVVIIEATRIRVRRLPIYGGDK